MSGLLRNPVNPLSSAAPQANPVHEDIPSFDEAPAVHAEEMHYPTSAQPTAIGSYAGATLGASMDDGFDSIKVTFSSYPRVKLEAGKFWSGTENLGDAFVAHIAAVRRVYVIRDRADAGDKNGRAVWSDDGVTTTQGLSVEAVKAQWASEGYTNPVTRETGEAVAMIKDGKMAGRMVMLSIPQQSMAKLSGYHHELKLSRGLRASQVLTRVYVSEPVKASSGTFTPWGFAYAGPLDAN